MIFRTCCPSLITDNSNLQLSITKFSFRLAKADPILSRHQSNGGWWTCSESPGAGFLYRVLVDFLHIVAQARRAIAEIDTVHHRALGQILGGEGATSLGAPRVPDSTALASGVPRRRHSRGASRGQAPSGGN